MALNRVCLDASAYIRYRTGEAEAVELIGAARDVGLPVITLGELRTGTRLSTHGDEEERRLGQFLANPVVRLLSVEEAAADHYAGLVVELRRRGRPVPTNDIWIAALALRESATVLTADAHFQEFRTVSVRLLEGR